MLPEKNCTGCGACMATCPESCIKMLPDKDGFFIPEVNLEKCINCKMCEEVCPALHAADVTVEGEAPLAFAATAVDDFTREKSSSGGMFTAVAEKVLEKGGVVYGAAFSKDFSVEHTAVFKASDLDKLRRSKYVQSDLKNSFKEIKAFLNNNKTVMFCGTPCQAAGLAAYLKKPYDNLITVDFVCHGIPSPKAFKSYIDCKEKAYKSTLTAVNFRDKSTGWKNFSVRLDFENDGVYLKQFGSDSYMKAFLANISLRPCCYNCKFKLFNHKSDLTLADFWGASKVLPGTDDDKGVSLVTVQTPVGKQLVDEISENINTVDVNVLEAVQYNPCIANSVSEHNFRQYFFNRLGKTDFEKLVKSCLEPSYFARLYRKLLQLKSEENQ